MELVSVQGEFFLGLAVGITYQSQVFSDTDSFLIIDLLIGRIILEFSKDDFDDISGLPA